MQNHAEPPRQNAVISSESPREKSTVLPSESQAISTAEIPHESASEHLRNALQLLAAPLSASRGFAMFTSETIFAVRSRLRRALAAIESAAVADAGDASFPLLGARIEITDEGRAALEARCPHGVRLVGPFHCSLCKALEALEVSL